MADIEQPKLQQEYLEFLVRAGTEIPPIDLKKSIDNPQKIPLKFSAELSEGGELPASLTCSDDGVISGKAEKESGSFLPYSIVVVAQNDTIEPLTFDVYLHIEPLEGKEESVESGEAPKEPSELEFDLEQFDHYWQSFSDKLDLPDLEELLTRRITRRDIYYFIDKFATLTVWNSDDYRPADDGVLIKINGASDHFMVYNFDVALVASPKDLFSTTRTPGDALQTARAMVQEAYSKKWNIELAGFDKMVSAAWVEAEWLNKNKAEYQMAVKNFIPNANDWTNLSLRMKVTK